MVLFPFINDVGGNLIIPIINIKICIEAGTSTNKSKIIKRNTPVDEGRLRSSMGYTIDSKVITPETPTESEDKLRSNIKKDVVILGTNVVYAPKIEFVPSRSTANLGFMSRSFNQLKPVAMRIFEEFLRGAIDR